MHLSQLVTWKGKIDRKDYLIWGGLLFAIKYNIDRLIAWSFNGSWFISDYFVQADQLGVLDISTQDRWFYITLLAASLPFIWFGTALTVKRLRSAGLSSWLVLLFFLPFLNIVFFMVMAILPASEKVDLNSPDYLGRLMPENRLGSALLSIGLVTNIGLLMTMLFVNYLEAYGWGLFVGVPFFLGFGSVLIYGYNRHLTLWDALGVMTSAVALFSLIIFILAMEGIICLVMAFPILFGVAIIGAILGYAIHVSQRSVRLNVLVGPLLLIPFLGIIEEYEAQTPPTFQVATTVMINAQKQAVWDELVAFSEIAPPTEWLFSTGIAYPTHAEIKGRGVGAVRHCHFTTGAFVEPITTWDEPHLLAFDVLDQPPPMVEWSFYEDLDMEHLHGYFRSQKGQFKLETLPDGTTKLTGTTWYKHHIWPTFYWRIWSDPILHQIHYRVLNHIKKEAEKS